MNKENLIKELNTLIEPIVNKLNYELYHLEFVKESGENYLRIYIDTEKGIGLEDCEKVSRTISDMLDEVDPIEESYYLEVSSPGIDRELYNDKHLEKNLNSEVSIKLSSLLNGNKKYEGTLKYFDSACIKIESEGKEIVIPREKIQKIKLKVEF
ncbi:ribosome maturation factor RimP [Clostridium tetanomorphum]|uniref:Ribosome maturation factor RimP n=1 Tax=Clostridium tetanomorphum TaxID=1553 RepID=A0A923EBR5_CLOTT|nr:ribosome maturation factor RimP [Clostridium tetanomorphum]KAJ51563.1 ribosome maturation protein RimP [Clostridium tetanomorphum DSM 665]MBC2398917.1 ribosome maturation factor RimP [Clostridium tetanomorphum]MBP1865212.1 ribosome maturation factor RimP [Clostridium tetanomorphum]NRS84649.1 ribosome maturation factor RimP [Clostridium tetanomorphum]NRZ97864.1 ribosome maturation factor RimP [Clostridium tetanomorphum]